MLTLSRGHSWRSDLLGALLIAVSLIKPTLSVPVVWVAFLKPQRFRPAVLIVGTYLVFTLVAAAFQPVGLVELLRGWLDQSGQVSMGAASFNLQKLLASAGLEHLFLPAGLTVGVMTGLWVFRHREVDV